MKFLCVRCDEPMKLQSAGPPEDGSINALFTCPSCSYQIAMLTNPHETQLVQSLGVKIGPGEAAEGMAARAEAGGCPFSGMIAEMESRDGEISWTDEALARLERIPDFVRPMAKQGIEHYAKTNGHALIDDALMEEARGRFGM
jgi:DNA-directed RNA polymerase subunit RPC12/RpoP